MDPHATLIVAPSPLSLMSDPSNRDAIAQLLADKRSPHTKAAYEKDLRDFFKTLTEQAMTPELVTEFLALDRFRAVALVLSYKAKMIERGLAEATINRRLAAIKALVKHARKVGLCNFTLEDVRGEKVQKYRDTSGLSREVYRTILAQCDRSTLAGKRDYALLRLLWDNALRRGEVAFSSLKDFDAEARILRITGKGRGSQVEAVGLSSPTVAAILDWLQARRELNINAPLFCALDPGHAGHRLTGESIRQLVVKYSKAAGVAKQVSPHRIRHSSITAALDATDGNVRKVQKLSRHAKLDTLMIYDDNRQRHQLEMSELLAEMV